MARNDATQRDGDRGRLGGRAGIGPPATSSSFAGSRPECTMTRNDATQRDSDRDRVGGPAGVGPPAASSLFTGSRPECTMARNDATQREAIGSARRSGSGWAACTSSSFRVFDLNARWPATMPDPGRAQRPYGRHEWEPSSGCEQRPYRRRGAGDRGPNPGRGNDPIGGVAAGRRARPGTCAMTLWAARQFGFARRVRLRIRGWMCWQSGRRGVRILECPLRVKTPSAGVRWG